MKISQREARRLRKRVYELERVLDAQKSRWATDWPASVSVAAMEVPLATWTAVKTARTLKHAVVAVSLENNRIAFFAAPLSE